MTQIILPYASSFDNDEFTSMLTESLDGDDKEQLIIKFQLYLIYGNDDSKFVIDLDDVWPWLGFSKKDKAKNLLMKNFEKDIDFTCSTLHPEEREQVHGGHNKETILLNVSTFKGLCMLANTEKGKKTRRYYSKMENIFFKYIVDKHQNTLSQIENNQNIMKKQHELDVQRKLVDSNKNTPLVYILKIQETDEETFTIKIGETDDIQQRMISLRQEYIDCVLIDVFPCVKPHAFEQYILHRKDVMKHRFMASETIQISPKFPYDKLLKIIKKNIHSFNTVPTSHLVEIERLKYQQKLIETIDNTSDPRIKEQLLDLLKNMSTSQPPNVTNDDNDNDDSENIPFRNRFVYQYDPSDLTKPIKIFKNLRQAARSLNNDSINDYHIRNAAANNVILSNFRWYVQDGEEANPPTELPPSQEENKTARNYGLIAQINKEKTQIINVFPNQREAEKVTNIINSQISIGIATGKLRSGFYWMLYENCTDELKSTFQGQLPQPKRPFTCSKVVQRIDPDTNEIIESYNCMQDVCKAFKCCHKSINKANETGDIFKGFKWNIVK
jgi:phage anti-repressor protein